MRGRRPRCLVWSTALSICKQTFRIVGLGCHDALNFSVDATTRPCQAQVSSMLSGIVSNHAPFEQHCSILRAPLGTKVSTSSRMTIRESFALASGRVSQFVFSLAMITGDSLEPLITKTAVCVEGATARTRWVPCTGWTLQKDTSRRSNNYRV